MLLTRSTCLLRAYILSASSRRTRLEVLQRGAHEGRPLARLHLRVQGMCVCLCVCMCTRMCGVHKASSERCVLLLPRHSAAPVAVAIATGGGLGYGAGAWGGLGLCGGRGSAAAAAVAAAAAAAYSAGGVSCGTTKTAVSTCHRTCKKLVIFQTEPSSSRVRPFLKSAVEPMHTDAPRLTCVLSREPGATNEEDASANESSIWSVRAADGALSRKGATPADDSHCYSRGQARRRPLLAARRRISLT